MHNRNRTLVAVIAAALVSASGSLLACNTRDPDPKYAKDGDTGAAAPATQQTLSPNPQMGDSTQGVRDRTQAPGMAGDSSGGGRASADSAGRPGAPIPGQPRTKRP